MSEQRNLIDRALNPRKHGADSDHCPACFGSCASFPGEWTEDAEELAVALATALESLLDKIEDGEGMLNALVYTDPSGQRVFEYADPRVVVDEDGYIGDLPAAVSVYLLGEETTRG